MSDKPPLFTSKLLKRAIQEIARDRTCFQKDDYVEGVNDMVEAFSVWVDNRVKYFGGANE